MNIPFGNAWDIGGFFHNVWNNLTGKTADDVRETERQRAEAALEAERKRVAEAAERARQEAAARAEEVRKQEEERKRQEQAVELERQKAQAMAHKGLDVKMLAMIGGAVGLGLLLMKRR